MGEVRLRRGRSAKASDCIQVIDFGERTKLTHDTVFVRDMSDVITYWNRGAQELDGWKAEEATGKRSHELLHTVLPRQVEEIHAELLRSGRWDGKLEKAKADGTQVAVASRWSLRRDRRAGLLPSWKPTTILPSAGGVATLNEELGKRTAAPLAP